MQLAPSTPQANLVAAQMYDAVWLYAKALKDAVENNYGIEDGERLVESMTGNEWNGKSSPISCTICISKLSH